MVLFTDLAACAPPSAQLQASCACCWLGCPKFSCAASVLAAESVAATFVALPVPALTLRAELGAVLSACRRPVSAEAAEGRSKPRAKRLLVLAAACGAVHAPLPAAAPCAMLGLLLTSSAACFPAPESAGSCCLAAPASSPAKASRVAAARRLLADCLSTVAPAVGDRLSRCAVR